MYRRFFLVPPNTRLGQRSGKWMKPIALPSGLNTFTPSSSSPLLLGAPVEPQPHQMLPSVSTFIPSRAVAPPSISLVLFDSVTPSAPTSNDHTSRFGCARDSMM